MCKHLKSSLEILSLVVLIVSFEHLTGLIFATPPQHLYHVNDLSQQLRQALKPIDRCKTKPETPCYKAFIIGWRRLKSNGVVRQKL
jgi:hypothetical protein